MNSSTEEKDNGSRVPVLQQNLELLKELPFLHNFPEKSLKLLAFLARRSTIPAGELLFDEGEDYAQAFLLLSGRLALLSKEGAEARLVRHYHPGDFLGSISLLGAMPSLFALQAVEASAVLAIGREHFAKILEQFPETGKLALRAFLEELHLWERKNLAESDPASLHHSGATVL
jgi:CRP-like cAMP-binding protein